jgi:hypothetical protein
MYEGCKTMSPELTTLSKDASRMGSGAEYYSIAKGEISMDVQ